MNVSAFGRTATILTRIALVRIRLRYWRAVNLYWRLRVAHREWKLRIPYGELRSHD